MKNILYGLVLIFFSVSNSSAEYLCGRLEEYNLTRNNLTVSIRERLSLGTIGGSARPPRLETFIFNPVTTDKLQLQFLDYLFKLKLDGRFEVCIEQDENEFDIFESVEIRD